MINISSSIMQKLGSVLNMTASFALVTEWHVYSFILKVSLYVNDACRATCFGWIPLGLFVPSVFYEQIIRLFHNKSKRRCWQTSRIIYYKSIKLLLLFIILNKLTHTYVYIYI